jgi:hypothetical protein
MEEHSIEVYGRTYQVKLYQRSKTVWVAFGYYDGRYLETSERTDDRALTSWRIAAEYRGDSIPRD